MSPIRECLVFLSVLAIANARNNVNVAIKLIKPFNQKDFQQISWTKFIGLEQDWNKLQNPLSDSANTEMNKLLTNVNEGYDNFGRSINNIVSACITTNAVLAVFENNNKFNEYNDQLALQKNSFEQATNNLRVVKTKMEAAALSLEYIDIAAEKQYLHTYLLQQYDSTNVEDDSNYWTKFTNILSSKPSKASKTPKATGKPKQFSLVADTTRSFNAFEKRFDEVKKGINSTVHTISDVIKKEDNVSENLDNEDEEDVPTVAEIRTFAKECEKFLKWNNQTQGA